MEKPIIEAYIGEYASGKSETAINRALWLMKQGRDVTLVDLDVVEPFYTLRPIKKKLEDMGITVVAWESREIMGLGEAGNIIMPELRWVLKRAGDLILDVGYGVEGAKTLNLIYGADQNPYLKIYAVVNVSRPMTSTVEDIVGYVRSLGRVDGIVNNTHLGSDTKIEVIQNGLKVIDKVARALNIPVLFTVAEKKHQPMLGALDCAGNQILYIERFMTKAFW